MSMTINEKVKGWILARFIVKNAAWSKTTQDFVNSNPSGNDDAPEILTFEVVERISRFFAALSVVKSPDDAGQKEGAAAAGSINDKVASWILARFVIKDVAWSPETVDFVNANPSGNDDAPEILTFEVVERISHFFGSLSLLSPPGADK